MASNETISVVPERGSELTGLMDAEAFARKCEPFNRAEQFDVDVAEGAQFSISGENRVHFQQGDVDLEFDGPALTKMASDVGFPKAYLKKIKEDDYPTLVLPHLNHWYISGMMDQMLRFIAVDNVVQSISKNAKESVSIMKMDQLQEVATEVIGAERILGYHKVYPDWKKFQFAIVTDHQFTINTNSPQRELFAGIQIRHSPLAERSTTVVAYVFAQWCSNGAITMDKLGSWSFRRGNGDDDFRGWFRKTVESSEVAIENERQRLQLMADTRTTPEHVAETIESTMQLARIPSVLQTQIRDAAVNSPPETLYDVYNLITRVGTHSEYLSPATVRRIDGLASSLSSHADLCPTCHRLQ